MHFLKNPFKGRLSSEGYLFPVALLLSFPILRTDFFMFISLLSDNDIPLFYFEIVRFGHTVFLMGFFIFLLVPFFLIPATVRRLHDINKSGWFAVFILIPLVNIYIALLLLSLSGNAKENTYGEVAQSKSKNPVILLFLAFSIVLSIFVFFGINS